MLPTFSQKRLILPTRRYPGLVLYYGDFPGSGTLTMM